MDEREPITSVSDNRANYESRSARAANGPRRWRRRIAVVVIVMIGFVGMAPYAMAFAPVRHLLFLIVFWNLNGTVTAERARVGWFSPPAFYGVELKPKSGPPLFRLDALESDIALWRLVLRPGSDLGQFRLERPWVRVQVDESGGNVREVFPGWIQTTDRPAEPTSPPVIPNLNVHVRIDGGRFSFQAANASQPWQIDGIDVTFGLRRTEGDAPDLVIHRGIWLDRVHVEPGMCNDFLMYIAPVLARTTRVEGEFSIEVDDGFLPLGEPGRGNLSGRLKIHRLDVGPGELARVLAELLKLPPSLLFASDSVVEFKLADGRVHHDELAFTLEPFQVRTSGSVGLDQSLDLMADITLPEFDVPQDAEAPVRRALSGQTLRLAIGGTLAEPLIDHRDLSEAGLGLVLDAVENLLKNRPVTRDLLERLHNRDALSDGPLRSEETEQEPLRSRLFRRRGLLNRRPQ